MATRTSLLHHLEEPYGGADLSAENVQEAQGEGSEHTSFSRQAEFGE